MTVARSKSTMHNGTERGGGVGHWTVAGGGGRRTGRPWRTGLELAGDMETKTEQSGPLQKCIYSGRNRLPRVGHAKEEQGGDENGSSR